MQPACLAFGRYELSILPHLMEFHRLEQVVMHSLLRAALMILVLGGSVIVRSDEPLTDEQAQEVVERGIRDLREKLTSDNEQTRLSALEEYYPDRGLLTKLFGDEAQAVFELLDGAIDRTRANNDKIKDEIAAQGKLQRIRLFNVRKDDASGRFKQVLPMLPKDLFIYRAVVDCENGGSGSSSYVVVSGRMRFVPQLESIGKFLLEAKKP